MAPSHAPAEPYVTSFETTVERVDDRSVVLADTYFYPEGGGQPADRGTVAGTAVADVQSRDGAVVHVLADDPGLSAGETIHCEIDEAFRTYCMRSHTASHALYGAARQLLDGLGYGGFGIDERHVRIDFETTTDVNDETLVELERLVNRVVWESRPVSWTTVPREEALSRDDVAFNAKTEEGVGEETVRLVTIEGDGDGPAADRSTADTSSEEDDASEDSAWDVAACGGTHVETTSEIGPVTIVDRSNPGEGLTRVEFSVGPPGIESRSDEKAAALDAAGRIGTSVEDLPDAVDRLRTERTELQEELSALRDELVERRIAELSEDPVERDGAEWIVGTVSGVDANDLADHARSMAGDAADAIALAGRDGRTFVAVAAGEGIDAGSVVEELTDEFGGGGGGSPTFAQGGGIDADPEAIVEYLG